MKIERPSLLQSSVSTPVSDIFVRELIQNSWDSADDQRRYIKKSMGIEEVLPFTIDFEFDSLTGTEKKSLIDGAKLKELRDQLKSINQNQLDQNGKRFFDVVGKCFKDLSKTNSPLNILKIIESGTGGMHGKWGTRDSRLYAAMLSVGNNQGSDDAGGSFGYGKAGLIQASGPSIVYAYTAVDPTRLDKGDKTSRMFLGVAYWDQYQNTDGTDFSGWSTLGLIETNRGKAIATNDEADRLAASLGIETRDPNISDEIGTTFLILEPNVNAESLKEAVETWWWEPLINKKKEFSVKITDAKGKHCDPAPTSNRKLSAFIEAFLTDHDDNPQVLSKNLGSFDKSLKQNHIGATIAIGKLKLAVDTEPGGWSFPEKEGESDESLIALMRKTGMVVEYSRRNTSPPYARGCFIASEGVANDLLRQTEPQLHQHWAKDKTPDIPLKATDFSNYIHKRVGDELRAFRNNFIKRRVATTRIRHKLFDQLCGGNPDGEKARKRKKPPTSPKEVREVSIQTINCSPVKVNQGAKTIAGLGKFHFAPMPKVAADAPFEIEITVGYYFVDDTGNYDRKDPHELNIEDIPTGFTKTQRDGKVILRGKLKSQGVNVTLKSNPHSVDFTGKFVPTAAKLNQAGDTEEESL